MIVVRGIDPGVVSPGFRLAGLEEDLAALDAQARAAGLDPADIRGGTSAPIRTQPTSPDAPGVRMDPSALIGGGVGDFLKNILGQGASAGQQFTSSIAALQAAEAQRERSRTLKLVGGGLLALAFVGGGIYAVSRLSKR